MQVPTFLSETTIRSLLAQKAKNQVPLAAIREETHLYRPGSTTPSSLADGTRAVNVSTLIAYQVKEREEEKEEKKGRKKRRKGRKKAKN